MPGPVRLEKLRNVRHERIVRVGVGEERTDTQQNLTDRQCWTPLVLENIQADTSVRVDVAVVDACGKVDFGRLQRGNGAVSGGRQRTKQQRIPLAESQ